jgi:hypothetical protein
MEDILDTLDLKGIEWFISELQMAAARHEQEWMKPHHRDRQRQVASALWMLAIEVEKSYHERVGV